MTNYILDYAEKIENGEIITSNRVKKVYLKLKKNILDPQGKYIFDEARANYAIDFIELFCKQSKGDSAGQPLKLELFQKAYISALFGFVDKNTGKRQYKESMFMVARKNGKSVMLSAIALYMMVADHEAGAEVASVATKKDQAKLVFDEALNMVRQSKDLSRKLRKRKTDLFYPSTMSTFQALGANSDTLDGLNLHLGVIDELHAIKSRDLYEVIKQSMSFRSQPMLIMITTAGTVRENIFDDMYLYATNVADDVFTDERFLPIIYELDTREDYKNADYWIKANPGLGTIKNIEYIEEQIGRAKNNPVDLRGILVKDFNIRENVSGRWLTFEQINNEDTFDMNDFEDFYFIGGADLSKSGDLTSATLTTLDKYTDQKYAIQMYWIPEDTLDKRPDDEKQLYQKWIDKGLLRTSQGNTINYSDVTAWFIEMIETYRIRVAWVYYDAWSAKYWVEEMEGHGFEMVEAYQGYKTLSLPMQVMGADLEANRINYNNNPVLKWCLSNTSVKSDINGNIQPKKDTERKRIDGTASLLDSYVGLQANYLEFKEAQPNRSVENAEKIEG